MDAIYGYLLECADADMAFSYFEDFLVHSTAKSTIFELITSFSVVGEILFGIFSQSNTLSSYLINNSQKIFWLIENETLSKIKTKNEFYGEIFSIVSKTDNSEKNDYHIRQYRKNEYLRIAAREIIGACSFEEIMEELSYLAEALIEIALLCAKRRLRKRYGYEKSDFCVIGMGKLGNKELNFSSDIDLLFVHKDEKDGEYYNRVARTLISILNNNKEGGFVYRVDMRLRPGGKTAALSLTVNEYEDYYTTFGQMWEKMSLTKAYPVAGDMSVGIELLRVLKPFVYKKSFDVEYIREIRSLMFKIKKYSFKNVNSELIPYDKTDVKKGVGGIREVEFIVNYFQLIYGGRDNSIEHVSTCTGLRIIGRKGYMNNNITEFLIEAYLFLRKIEHKIQLLNEQQTQNLPVTRQSLSKLSKKLHMSVDDFLNKYETVTNKVHYVFNDIFIRDYKIPVFGTIDDVEGFLKEYGIKSFESVSALVKDSVKKFLAKDIKRPRIEEMFDYTFKFVKKEKFEKCVRGLGVINPTYTMLMFENKPLFNVLLRMLSIDFGPMLALNEEIFEYFISSDTLEFYTFDKSEFEKAKLFDIFHLLFHPYDYKPYAFMNFTNELIKSIAFEYDTDKKLGIVGYGKLATGELFIGSDLDLIFVSLNNYYLYLGEVQKIIKRLKNFYDVDLRLRPYGDKSPIVIDIEYLRQYFEKSAWMWEKQAAQKSRVIYSGFDSEKINKIYSMFVISNPPTKKDVVDMKHKIEKYKGKSYDIKSFDGGINDIEFLVQSVCFDKSCIKIGASCIELLDDIRSFGLIDVDILKEAYAFYTTTLNIHRLFAKGSIINDFETLEFLSGRKNLKNQIEIYRKAVKQEFDRWFEK